MRKRKRKFPKQNIGGKWHTDHSYDEAPTLGSVIYALEVPPVGGDTLFASMRLAFETLSDGMKAMLSKLEAVHSSRHLFGPGKKSDPDVNSRFRNAEQAVQDTVHPVVIRHPDTGRRVLYVNPGFTVAWWLVQPPAWRGRLPPPIGAYGLIRARPPTGLRCGRVICPIIPESTGFAIVWGS